MTTTHLNTSTDNWPKIAKVVNEVGKVLQEQYGMEPIPTGVIQRAIERHGGYARGSILPSDYCYNLLNKAAFSFDHPVFVRVARGQYRYIGPYYAYSGPIFWKPKGGEERQVGVWQEGVCVLDEDPRQS